nr:MAG TPA: hypothetical protein [Caudoviricetes sp.]
MVVLLDVYKHCVVISNNLANPSDILRIKSRIC